MPLGIENIVVTRSLRVKREIAWRKTEEVGRLLKPLGEKAQYDGISIDSEENKHRLAGERHDRFTNCFYFLLFFF